MTAGFLPTLNASLNALATLFLVFGFAFIRRRNVPAHRFCMIAAFSISCLFLVSYLVHHARVGSVPFAGPAALRPYYFAVLVPHIVLAALVPPLAIVTILRGLRRDDAAHRRLARWTLPIWLYVSVSGVVIYYLLYRL